MHPSIHCRPVQRPASTVSYSTSSYHSVKYYTMRVPREPPTINGRFYHEIGGSFALGPEWTALPASSVETVRTALLSHREEEPECSASNSVCQTAVFARESDDGKRDLCITQARFCDGCDLPLSVPRRIYVELENKDTDENIWTTIGKGLEVFSHSLAVQPGYRRASSSMSTTYLPQLQGVDCSSSAPNSNSIDERM